MGNLQTIFSKSGSNLKVGESSDWMLMNVRSGLIEIYGTFGGAAVEFDLSGDPMGDDRDPNSPAPTQFAPVFDSGGSVVSVNVERSDIPFSILAELFRMRARVVGGDGTTDLFVRATASRGE